MLRLFGIRFFSRSHKLLAIIACCAHCITMVIAILGANSNYFEIAMMFTIPTFLMFGICADLVVEHDEEMENECPSFWKKEFHRAIMHSNWAKIYAYASEFSRIFEKYAYFYICTDSFHDLPLDQLERAMNIFAEKNPEFFTEQLIETVLSDAENGLENTYLVDFSSEETLEIEKLETED
ncbi:hypothetical protein DXD54_08240 [Clostridium sp. TM06-18]|nr:hypothetical protein DXD54_08240 [Clostridium sp. TM06-18]